MRRALLTLAVLALAARAAAGPADPGAADALFDAGQKAMERGDYVEACAKFGESQRLDPGAGTLLNIGACSEKLGRLVTAWESYREAVRMLPPDDQRVGYANERLDAVSARVPMLTVRLKGRAPEGTEITRNGVALGAASLGAALPVDPGKVRLEVRAPGRRPRQVELVLAEGERREISVEAGEKQAPAAARSSNVPPRPPPPTQPPDRTLGFVVGGVGLATLAASGITTLLMLRQESKVEDGCDTSTKVCDSQAGVDAASTGKIWSTVSTVLFSVGVAGVGAGTFLVLTAEPRSAGARRAGLTPATLALGGRF